MRATLALALLLCTASAVPLATAYTGYRLAVLQGSADAPALLTAGAVTCDRSGLLVQDSCDYGGVGGARFSDIGCWTGWPGCLDEAYGFAHGTCTADVAVPLPVTPPSGFFVCGTDRDDDFLVTNVDLTGTDDWSCNWGTGTDCYDDEFAEAPLGDTINVCFTRDRGTFDPLDPNVASGDWDDIFVFVGLNAPSSPPGPSVLAADVILDLVNDTSCGSPSLSRSGHDDQDWPGGPRGASSGPPSGLSGLLQDLRTEGLLLVPPDNLPQCGPTDGYTVEVCGAGPFCPNGVMNSYTIEVCGIVGPFCPTGIISNPEPGDIAVLCGVHI
jgi:hypothetical protein